jgi:hypothetical protein
VFQRIQNYAAVFYPGTRSSIPVSEISEGRPGKCWDNIIKWLAIICTSFPLYFHRTVYIFVTNSAEKTQLNSLFETSTYYPGDQIKKNDIGGGGGAGLCMGVRRDAYRVFVEKPEGNTILGSPRCKWQTNTKNIS